MTGDEKFKVEIVRLLEHHPEGLSIREISIHLRLHRHTVAKYVLVLEAVGKVYRRKIGSATLNYLSTSYSGRKGR